MNTKPEALRLADALEDTDGAQDHDQAAAELRRLHEENQALRQALAQPKQETLGSEWVPCVKLPVIVHVRNQREGENHISTREGITPVLPDDLIMRGVAGEEYPIGRDLFERTYTFDVDTVNTSQERVDKTAKRGHEPVAFGFQNTAITESNRWMMLRETIPADDQYQGSLWTPLYTAPPKREWVGLTDEEAWKCWDWEDFQGTWKSMESKLKEKNT